MKVLVLAPSMGDRGGIQRYTANLEKALAYLMGDKGVHCLPLSRISGCDQHNPVKFHEKLRFVLRAIWLAIQWKPDLVICTHIALGPVGRLLAILKQIPFMIVVHGIESWGHLSPAKTAALSFADRVVVTTAFSQQQLVRKHPVRLERIVRLPCMLDEALLKTKSPTDAIFKFLSSGQPVILTVARMDTSERYKGHDVVLRALPDVVSRVPNLAYVIVGDGDDRPRLQTLVGDLGLGQHVFFTGSVSDPELAAIYRRSKVFVLPARTVVDDDNPKGEGFGIVFLEAMAFGKPVIGPNYGAPTEFIRPGENGLLVDPEDAASVAQALLELLQNPNAARKMGEAGRALVQKQYTYESFRSQLQEMIGVLGIPVVDAIAPPCES